MQVTSWQPLLACWLQALLARQGQGTVVVVTRPGNLVVVRV